MSQLSPLMAYASMTPRCRDAERSFHNQAMDLLDEAADTEA
ncbi:hypothetical protein ACIQMR_01925 [Streptomyces sp. NPDC091376]